MMRALASQYSIVIDGRDIGTKVFPDTPYKFYLDANPAVRAKRRALETGVPLKGVEFDQLLHQFDRKLLIGSLQVAPQLGWGGIAWNNR